MSIIWAILSFLIFILIHELGHFVAAKKSNIKVEEFSIGMGPKLLQRNKGETVYTLRALPIGGYCALTGEDEESTDERAFNNAKASSRLVTILAGAFNNFVFGLILCIIVMTFSSTEPTIGEFLENSPAEEMGLKKGDTILEINNKKIMTREDVQRLLQENKEKELTIRYRDSNTNEENTLTGYAKLNTESNLYQLGFTFENSYGWENFSIINGLKNGSKLFINFIVSLYSILWMLLSGQISVKGLSGPVGVVSAISQAASTGIISLMMLLAYININLGVMNLLPFPALDGGRAVFILIEMITGKKISSDLEAKIHTIGLVLLLGLILFVTMQDILRLF